MFTMRKTKPSLKDKYHDYYINITNGGQSWCINGKPKDSECNVLANCVGYACGRFNEIYSEETGHDKMKFKELNCNAENFIERAKNLGLEISNKPTLGGIMVWQKGNTLSGSDGAGHVCIVEDIIDDNTIYTSESGYNSKAFWNTKRYNNNKNWGQSSNYKFRGCIVNPGVKEETKEVKKLSEEELIKLAKDVCDGKYGNGETRKKLLGDLYSDVQKIVNEMVKNKNNVSSKDTTNTNIYVVKKGDTLVSIARRYNTTWRELYYLNKETIDNEAKRHGVSAKYGYYNFIYIGEKLKIK